MKYLKPIWYCKVEFISGKEKNIYFENQAKAYSFYNSLRNKKIQIQFTNENYDKLLINLKNIETVTYPKEYIKDKVINN